MQKYALIFYFYFLSTCLCYANEIQYACSYNDVKMIFSESSIKNENLFSYQSFDENSFELKNDQLTVEKIEREIVVSAELINHPSYSRFFIIFPVVDWSNAKVNVNLQFIDNHGLVVVPISFECDLSTIRS